MGQAAEGTTPPDLSQIIDIATRLMEAARYCSLVTIDEDGHPQARLVDAFPAEGDLTVWIGTKSTTRKVGQIRRDPRVSLFYFDPESPGYVTLLGHAELIENPQEKVEYWKEEWAPFYEDGSNGKDYLLIRVVPRRLEIVSYGDGLLNDPESWVPVALSSPLD